MKSLLILIGCSAIGAAFAQPAPRLNSLSPDWLQRDTGSELILNGENLGGASRIVINGAPGVSAEIIRPPAAHLRVESSGQGVGAVAPPETKQLKIALKMDAAAGLVERELRVVTADGISNPLTFRLGSLPELRASNNQSRGSAQPLALPAVVSGTISAAAQSHFYRFAAKKGEKVLLNVEAYRLGSRLDSSLVVRDTSGKELARNEDAVGLDSVLEFDPPGDGEYLAELRDFSYQGGGDYKYRLNIGVLPYVRSVFPFGGQRGKAVELRLEGANLGGIATLLLGLASDADLGQQEIRASTPLGLSNPFPFEVSDLPSFAESEPNSALDQADAVTLPVAIDGRINKTGDYDAFKFHAAKDQRVIFEVQAFRHGSALDPVLLLTDDSGNVLQRNDDASGADARLDYTFKEAGEYVVIVEDLLRRGGEQFGYRLAASIPQPDFSVTLTSDTPRVRRGNRVPVRVEVNRMNGFKEPVRIECEQLPSGLFAEPLIVPPEAGSAFLVIEAAPEAKLEVSPLRVKGSAGDVRREAKVLSGDKAVKSAFLTVLDEAPFAISSATLMASIEQSQSGRIDVLIDRKPGFSQEIQINPEGFSTGREPIGRSFEFQPLVIKAGESRGTLSLKAKNDSEIAVGNIFLRGDAEVNGNTVSAYSALLPIGTVQIPFVLSTSLKRLVVTALPSSSASAASQAVFTVKTERRMGFEGEIELTLDGVPEGVSVLIPKVAAKANEATVQLTAGEKAPAGKEMQLTLRGTGQHQDRIYRFSAPPVSLVINAAESEKEPKLAKTAPAATNTTASTNP